MLFLGIDGGGTKTDFLIKDLTGKTVARKLIGTLSYKHIGMDQSVEGLKCAVSDMISDIDDEIYTCLAFPTWGESVEGEKIYSEKLREIFPGPVKIVNDCVAAWAGSLALQEGINLVAGTGSIAYGRRNTGEDARAGGWCEQFSDEGSCYWLGMKALQLFSKESDGRSEKGKLLNVFREQFELHDDFEIIDIFENNYKNNRTKIAGLQKLLLEAAHRGDNEAEKLYRTAAGELGHIVEAVRKKLGFESGTVVSCSGGLFHAGNLVLEPLKDNLSKQGIILKKPRFTPVQGAVLVAAEEYFKDEKLLEDFIVAIEQDV